MLINKQSVLGAIEKINNNEALIKKHSSTFYDLVYSNKRYPPKLVYSLAHELATGEELPHNTFEGGENTVCFNELRSLGFKIEEKFKTRKFWLYAAGENAELWQENLKEGIMSLGWNELGDLRKYKTKEDIQATLKSFDPNNGSKKNDALANYEFCYSISEGDIIVVKQGTKKYLGFGVVTSKYQYFENRQSHKSIRAVNWKEVYLDSSNIVQKTLTDITKYPAYVLELIMKLGIFGEINYWFVAQGDSYKDPDSKRYLGAPRLDKSGSTKVYWENMKKVKANDLIFNYSNKEIRGFSIANTDCIEGKNPFTSKWNEDGYTVGIDHFPFKRKETVNNQELIEVKDKLQDALYGIDYKPFNINGGVNQGYLYQFSREAASILMERIQLRNGYKKLTEANETTTQQDDKMEGLNLILFGPTGTGKTYTLKNKYFPKYEDERPITKKEFIQNTIKELTWKNAISLALLQLRNATVKEIIESTFLDEKIAKSNAKPDNISNIIWGTLQSGTKEECEYVNVSHRDSLQIFWKDEYSKWSIDENLLFESNPELKRLNEDISNFKETVDKEKRYVFTTFHQSYSYEDFIEGLKPQINEDGSLSYAIVKGVFREIVDLALNNPEKPYAIFIDEINRGNVASIFGELITLIEEDKRIGKENFIPVKLPYSKDEFGVPSNLSIIGTMNTADKSVEQLDAALRRRFQFISLDSNPELLESSSFRCKGISLSKLLFSINERLEALLDKDHKVGHANFMSIKDLDNPLSELKIIFEQKIIPQLRDYFFNDYQKIEMILGNEFVKKSKSVSFKAESMYGDDESFTYTLSDSSNWTLETFKSIYE